MEVKQEIPEISMNAKSAFYRHHLGNHYTVEVL